VKNAAESVPHDSAEKNRGGDAGNRIAAQGLNGQRGKDHDHHPRDAPPPPRTSKYQRKDQRHGQNDQRCGEARSIEGDDRNRNQTNGDCRRPTGALVANHHLPFAIGTGKDRGQHYGQKDPTQPDGQQGPNQ
jgi:hypothetical protein